MEDLQGMLCKLCHKHGHSPQKAIIGHTVWVDLPCKTIIRQSLVKHNKSEARSGNAHYTSECIG